MGLFTKVKTLFGLSDRHIALGIMHLTLQYPVVGVNTKEKCNDVEEEEHIFHLPNKYF